MPENILQNIIQKKIEKIDKLKKSLDLKTLDELINKNNSYINFKDKIENNIKNNKTSIISEIKKYSNAKDIVWAQEEPRNMGAWNHIQTYHPIAKNMRPATRRFYGSTASGSYVRFERRHNQVIEYVFDKTKNNFKK